jgi:hypothetical protein
MKYFLIAIGFVLLLSACNNESKQRPYRLDTLGHITFYDLKTDSLAKEMKDTLPSVLIDSVKYYVVEGDLLMNEKDLYYYCLGRLKEGIPTMDSILYQLNQLTLVIGILPNGEEAKWNAGDIIRYSVSKSSFPELSNYNRVVAFMQKATADWSRVCNIKFEYRSQFDNVGRDGTPPSGIDFFVTEFDAGGAFIAESFFPGEQISLRKIRLDPSFYTSPYDMTGMLRHELGHILGFRHEHIFSNDRMCPVEGLIYKHLKAKPLTHYDPYSVMHYFCGNTKGDLRLLLTSYDSTGSIKVYPFKP